MQFKKTVANVAVEAFFDRVKVLKKRDQMEVKMLSRTGAYYRKVVMNSMKAPGKTAKTQNSKPGKPPKYHTRLLKDNIRFGYDRPTHSVLIGVLRFRNSQIPRVLEFGGASRMYTGEQIQVASRPFLGDTSVNWPKGVKKLKDEMKKAKI